MKVAIGTVIGLVLGFMASFALFHPITTKQHWQMVERVNAFARDPANFKPDPDTGLVVATPPADPLPSLAALVAAGEVRHVNLVLPTVPNSSAATKHWMKFCDSHPEIVYISGNPSYPAFRPAGAQPLHLNIWFRDADEGVVKALIQELEERFGSERAGQGK